MTYYLDNAASSCPKPPEVIEAVETCLRDFCANPGRGAHKKAVAAARVIFQARQKTATFLGIKNSADLIFTQNATDALNLAMYGLLQPGDHVVTTAVEHNAIARPLRALSTMGVTVDWVPADIEGTVAAEHLLAAVRPDTALVVLSHASNVTGAFQPVFEIASRLQERGVPLLVDAAQTAGTLIYDMEQQPITMLACTGHKSLMGPQGIGMLYIAPGLELRSFRQGGTGTHSTLLQDELARPDRYEAGTLNNPGIAGLGAAIDYLERSGMAALAAHKEVLLEALMSGLGEIDGVRMYGPAAGQPRCPLVAFNIKELAPSLVAARLDKEFDVASRAGLHCSPGAHEAVGSGGRGSVRLSIGPFNNMADIEAAVDAAARIAAEA